MGKLRLNAASGEAVKKPSPWGNEPLARRFARRSRSKSRGRCHAKVTRDEVAECHRLLGDREAVDEVEKRPEGAGWSVPFCTAVKRQKK